MSNSIRGKEYNQIVLFLNEGKTPKQIQNMFQFKKYTLEQILCAARRAGFGYIKRDGKWYAEQKF